MTDTTLWRTRFMIMSAADLSQGPYSVMGAEIVVWKAQQQPDGTTLYLVDLKGSGDTIRDAAIKSFDLINNFLDRLSLLSYGPSKLMAFISTCPAEVPIGSQFELLVMNLHVFRSPAPVTPSDVQGLDDVAWGSRQALALRYLRDGLSGEDIVDSFLALWRALEIVAEDEATERIETKCTKCGELVTSRPATHRRIRELFSEAGSGSKEADEAREMRGRYTHGGGLRDADALKKLTQTTAIIQSVASGIVANRTGHQVLDRRNLLFGLPFIVHRVELTSEAEYRISPDFQLAAPVIDTMVPLIGARDHAGTLEFGLELKDGVPILPEYALPVEPA